jgi:hypothetical protein
LTEEIPLKKSRFTDSQIIAILKQAEAGTPVPELCREHGMVVLPFLAAARSGETKQPSPTSASV